MSGMYEVWLGEVMLPVAPGKIQTKVSGNNKTINLINEAEVNQIRGMKLTEYSFEMLLPGVEYPFAVYQEGFRTPEYYLGILEEMKLSKAPFNIKIIRKDFSGNPTFDTSKDVTLEDYTIKENAEEGLDVIVDIELKAYVKYGIKKVTVKGKKFRISNIDTNKKKIVRSYTTKKGDTLRLIGKKVYGINTLSNAEVIYKRNKKKIDASLRKKFGGKFTKRIYTTSLSAGIKLTIPGYYENMGSMIKE